MKKACPNASRKVCGLIFDQSGLKRNDILDEKIREQILNGLLMIEVKYIGLDISTSIIGICFLDNNYNLINLQAINLKKIKTTS